MGIRGVIIKGVGGLYTVFTVDGQMECRARGAFRHERISPTVGDRVRLALEAESYIIDVIEDRRNLLIRPPMANLDTLFAIIPTCRPAPDLSSVDKLLCIAEHADIDAAVIITKREMDEDAASRMADIYRRVGYNVFPVSAETGEGLDGLSSYIGSLGCGKSTDSDMIVTAFAGASGAGKSTLLNKLYPDLHLGTGALSRRISRGRQTTRHVELYPTGEGSRIYVADTPGFSLLDFERFDFFSVEALPFTFREFEPYHGKCRYTKCTHVCEDGCAVIDAVNGGTIPRERHESYRALYAILKDKRPWDK